MTAFAGTYHELRAVKTRGTWQVVVELPRHEAERLIAAWGLPDNATERWVALALLKPSSTPSEFVRPVVDPPALDAREPAESKALLQAEGGERAALKREAPQRCPTAGRPDRVTQWFGMACQTPKFGTWLGEYMNFARPLDRDEAATAVRQFCGVKSRGEFATNPVARQKALDLMTDYEKATGQLAEDRS